MLETRDNWVNRLGVSLILASVEEALANGIVPDHGKTSRDGHEIGTLLHGIEENGFTVAFDGERREGEKTLQKRVHSRRDNGDRWDPMGSACGAPIAGGSTAASTCGYSHPTTGPSSISGTTWPRRNRNPLDPLLPSASGVA